MNQFPQYKQCLTHQLPEDQATLLGLVCCRCKHRLYTQPPCGQCREFWESQPVAYLLSREPCFVYRLVWNDFVIRSLHPPCSTEDTRCPERGIAGSNSSQLSELLEEDDDFLDDGDPETMDVWGA